MAVGARGDLLVEVPLLLAVEDDQVDAVLERPQGRPDRLALVDDLVELVPARVDLALRRAVLDLAGREDLDQGAPLLATAESRDLLGDDAGDQGPQRERLTAAGRVGRQRNLPAGDERAAAAGRSGVDREQRTGPPRRSSRRFGSRIAAGRRPSSPARSSGPRLVDLAAASGLQPAGYGPQRA